ncbi:MAG: hypothetical protein ACI89E_002327, partial [Planctomycetota bacterium]
MNLFQKNIDVVPSNQDSAKHYMAIVRATLARLSMEAGDLQAAQVLMLESLKTAPLSASAL